MTPTPPSDVWPGGGEPPGRPDDSPRPGPPPEPEVPEDVSDAEVVADLPGSAPSEEPEGRATVADKPGEPATDEVVEGEIVDPGSADEALADALLAEALDEEAIEAQFTAAEAEARSAAQGASAEQVAALTADLQRVHAEYSNYRKRVERDRELVRERAVEGALVELLPILDDIGRARDHHELVGGFRSVGEALEAAVTRLGLVRFGEPGELFDPTRHEALMREEREGVTEPTIVSVLQSGYEMNGRVVRPARVSVAGTD